MGQNSQQESCCIPTSLGMDGRLLTVLPSADGGPGWPVHLAVARQAPLRLPQVLALSPCLYSTVRTVMKCTVF